VAREFFAALETTKEKKRFLPAAVPAALDFFPCRVLRASDCRGGC